MKKRRLSLLLVLTGCLPLVSGCSLISNILNPKTSSESQNSSQSNSGTSSSSNGSSNSSSSGSPASSSSSSSGQQKVTVDAHTLSDTNPPINVDAKGQVVTESTWNSFRSAPDSFFNNNYNYTYTAYSGGSYTIENFTKNGYYVQSSAGRLYYERKSGSTFYQYISTSSGYLREETTLDLPSKYTYRIAHEIYVHMHDFSNYEYDDYSGLYQYLGSGFGYNVKFIGGYLVYLYTSIDGNLFIIDSTFETTIDIPQSYYYK